MNHKHQRNAITEPLILLLRSRRFITALAALIIGALVLLFPDLQSVRSEMLTLLIAMALALIAGYSIEDAATAANNRDPDLDTAALDKLTQEVIKAILDHIPDDEPDPDDEPYPDGNNTF